MKKIALLSFLAVVSLIISCKEKKITNEKRAENAVENYLDNLYGSSHVRIFQFKDFTTLKAYAEQSYQKYYEHLVKLHPKDTIGLKKDFEQEAANLQIGRKNWYKILCRYQAYNYMKIGENFYIDPEFKKVVKEMLITRLQERERYDEPGMASSVMAVTLSRK